MKFLVFAVFISILLASAYGGIIPKLIGHGYHYGGHQGSYGYYGQGSYGHSYGHGHHGHGHGHGIHGHIGIGYGHHGYGYHG